MKESIIGHRGENFGPTNKKPSTKGRGERVFGKNEIFPGEGGGRFKSWEENEVEKNSRGN